MMEQRLHPRVDILKRAKSQALYSAVSAFVVCGISVAIICLSQSISLPNLVLIGLIGGGTAAAMAFCSLRYWREKEALTRIAQDEKTVADLADVLLAAVKQESISPRPASTGFGQQVAIPK